jgi:hypothetical protein
MTPLSVVEHLNIFKDRLASHSSAFAGNGTQQFFKTEAETARQNAVVPAICLIAHAASRTNPRQFTLNNFTDLLSGRPCVMKEVDAPLNLDQVI